MDLLFCQIPDSVFLTNNEKSISERIDIYSKKIYDFARNNPEASQTMLDSVFSLLEHAPNMDQEIYALRGAAFYKMHQHQYDAAFSFLQKAQKLNQKVNDSMQQAGILIDYGNIYLAKAAADSALFYYISADSIAKNIDNPMLRGIALLNVGTIYQNHFPDYQKSLYYLNQAYELKEHSTPLNSITLFQKLAIAYRHVNQDSMALMMAEKSYELAKQEGLQGDAAAAINSMAQIYQKQGEYTKALEAFQQARQIAEQLNLVQGIIFTNGNIAETYYLMGRYQEGLLLYEKILSIAVENNFDHLELEIYNNMIRFYEKLKNFKLAFKTSEKLRTLSDSLSQADREQMLDRLEAQYQAQLKEETIARQEAKIKNDQIRLKLLSIISGIILLSLVLIWRLLILKKRSLNKLVNAHQALSAKNKQILQLIPIKSESETSENADHIYEKIYHHLIHNKQYLNESISLEKTANETGINREYIRSAIKNAEGCNFKTFINTYRIEHAKILLMEDRYGHFSMDEIARKSGFPSRTSFYRTFREITGFTPAYYKNQVHKFAQSGN